MTEQAHALLLLVRFLKLILPSEGVMCAVELPSKRHYFIQSLDELAARLLEIDSRKQNAYFACASFDPVKVAHAKARKRAGEKITIRSSANVLGVKVFWSDVDVGEGKPYATTDE